VHAFLGIQERSKEQKKAGGASSGTGRGDKGVFKKGLTNQAINNWDGGRDMLSGGEA